MYRTLTDEEIIKEEIELDIWWNSLSYLDKYNIKRFVRDVKDIPLEGKV